MIHVTIFQNKYKECVGFQTEGHAEYADPGQDICMCRCFYPGD